MEPFSVDAVRAAYDVVATDYAVVFGDELADLPLDRAMLDLAWTSMPDDGIVVEAGCGPAPAAQYLAGRGRTLIGVDISSEMLGVARTRNPGLACVQADLRALPLSAGCCALVIASYSLQHVARVDLGPTLAELCRLLTTGGVLVAAMHLGDGDVVSDEFLGHRVTAFGGALYSRDDVIEIVASTGLRIEVERERGPAANEFPSQRLYVIARRID